MCKTNGWYTLDEAGVRSLVIDYRDLPDPEDMAVENEFEFLGFYILMTQEYRRLGDANNALTHRSLSVEYESLIEQWLDRAQDWLPEWYNITGWRLTDDAGKQALAAATEGEKAE